MLFLRELVPCVSTALSFFGWDIAISRIRIAAMTGAVIAIDDASPADTILSVKQLVFAANRQLPVHRQRLVYRPGPFGMDALADDETLGGAGVARDSTAELDVLVEPLTREELNALGVKVRVVHLRHQHIISFRKRHLLHRLHIMI